MKDKQNKEIIFKLPDEVMETCQFTEVNALTIKASEGLAIIHKSEMTALEVAYAIDTISALATEMTVFLAKACGICDLCGDEPCSMLHGCDYAPADWVKSCALCGELLEDWGEVTVVEAGIQHDITDVPPDVLALLMDTGVCLAELDECIMREDIIYGN